MEHYIQFKKANCKNCYKCIRHCPVKSIRFADHQANIVKDQCILCGECFLACPQNAKQIRNDVAVIKEMFASGKTVYASVAPSFVANYEGSDIQTFETALKKLGFAGAAETALGASIVTNSYEEMINAGDGRVIISSCCHTVNSLIQIYYPEALPYLANVISPMQAHCMTLKEKHPDSCIVFIGPCISKKEEADQYPGFVDCVLTFEELTGWLKDEGITIENSTDKHSMESTGDRLYPVAGGIIRSIKKSGTEYNYVAIDGIQNCINALKDIINGNISNVFIEMSACAGSCIGGPAMENEHRLPVRGYTVIDQYAKQGVPYYAKQSISSCPDNKDIHPDNKGKLRKHFSYIGLSNPMPGSAAIEEILKKMGKTTKDQELNCGSCGYNTCHEKAIAVFQGKADLTMCLPFLKEKAENFSDNIIYNMPNGVIVLNEELEVQQINRAACNILNIRNKLDVLNCPVIRILNPSSYLEVMTSKKNIHDRLTYLAEYQRYVEETIIYDKTYHIIIGILRDITAEEKARLKKEEVSKRTIEITDKVIDKQMRVVQEIASLLGESAAEAQIALTNLKETLKNE